MAETLYLILGIFLLLLVMYDFFFSTLSGNGAGFISQRVGYAAHNSMRYLVKKFGRRINSISGLVVNMMELIVWVIIVWAAVFLIYSSNPSAVINEEGRIADVWERLYFTGYTLSTLGIGDFRPVTPLFEVLTSCFSFFGFIFFTSSMTYLISISSALIDKRTLTSTIHNLGQDPEAIVEKFLEMDSSFTYGQVLALQEMIDKHSAHYEAYPAVHFYSHPKAEYCLSINFTRLDEAVSIMLSSGRGENIKKELGPIRASMTGFLTSLNDYFAKSLPKAQEPVSSLPFSYEINVGAKEEVQNRRKVLEGFLKSEGFTWKDVHPEKSEK